MKTNWQVQEAKAEFSAVIAAAQNAPQIITRHGEPVAVVLSLRKYRQLSMRKHRETLFDFFRTWPDFDIPERDKSGSREVTL